MAPKTDMDVGLGEDSREDSRRDKDFSDLGEKIRDEDKEDMEDVDPVLREKLPFPFSENSSSSVASEKRLLDEFCADMLYMGDASSKLRAMEPMRKRFNRSTASFSSGVAGAISLSRLSEVTPLLSQSPP